MSLATRNLSLAPCPWKSPFLAALSSMPSPEFVLATLSPSNTSPSSSSATTATTPFLPRARFCIYRGMWAELPVSKHNAAPLNPAGAYSSELPTFTTDVRMNKVGDLFASSDSGGGGGGGGVNGGNGSGYREARGEGGRELGCGGGGPVEAVFWASDRRVQWRIRGTAWVVADSVEGPGDDASNSSRDGPGEGRSSGEDVGSGVTALKSEVGKRMRVEDEAKAAAWSWRREVVAQFGNVSPTMRGSWKNPIPGSKVEGEPDEDHKLGQKVDDLDDKISRSNFRVVIIKPDEVESVDLSDPVTGRRHNYKFIEENGEDQHMQAQDRSCHTVIHT